MGPKEMQGRQTDGEEKLGKIRPRGKLTRENVISCKRRYLRPAKESINHSAVRIMHFTAWAACGVTDTDIAKCHICGDNELVAAEKLSCHSQVGANDGAVVGAEEDVETSFTSQLCIISGLVWSLLADRPPSSSPHS